MRVIITGGTGLIGRALAADLAGDGHEVTVLSRRPEQATGLPAGVRAERWDARSAEGWGARPTAQTPSSTWLANLSPARVSSAADGGPTSANAVFAKAGSTLVVP